MAAGAFKREKISIDISVLGDKALQAKLSALPARAQRSLTGKALTAGARLVRDEARRLAPVDTGALKKSIKTKKFKQSRLAFGSRVVTGTRADLNISPQAKYYYPAVLEFKRRSYLRQALADKRADILGNMKRALKQALR